MSIRWRSMSIESPRPLRENFARRLARCVTGLAFFGIGIAFFVRANLGLAPWDVFHQGVSEQTGLALGVVLIITAFAVLLAWIPLRLRPGLGTLLNAVEIGLVEVVAQRLLPEAGNTFVGLLYLVAGMGLIACGSGLYIGAELGPGPRDGLMVGLNARFGISVRLARTSVECTVLVVGVLLGGSLGLGTFVFALGIGPLVQVTLRLFQMTPPAPADR